MSGAQDYAQPSQAPQETPQEAPQRTPGKRALTDGMSRRTTGIPYVDEGDEQAGPRAWLGPGRRGRLVQVLGHRAQLAHANAQSQIAAKRVEIALSKDAGWGLVSEVIFNALSFWLTGAVVAVTARMRAGAISALAETEIRNALTGTVKPDTLRHQLAARLPEGGVKEVMFNVTRGIRSHVMHRARVLPPEKQARADFLLEVSAGLTLLTASVVEDMPTVLDDDGLLLLTESYEASAHTAPVYAAALDDMLARFTTSEIAHVGQSWEHDRDALYTPGYTSTHDGRLDVVRFRFRGRERAALVENGRTVADDGGKLPLDMPALHGAAWVRWLDADLADAAVSQYRARVKAEPLVLDVDAAPLPPTVAGPVSAWIATAPEAP